MSLAACIAVVLIFLYNIMGIVTFSRFWQTRDRTYAVFTGIFLSCAIALIIVLMHFNPQY